MTNPRNGELTPGQRETRMREYALRDTHRRIRNIEDAYPRDSWTLDEARAVHAALSGIVRARQGCGGVCVTVMIASQSGGPDLEVSTRLENPAVELDRHAANGTVGAEQP